MTDVPEGDGEEEQVDQYAEECPYPICEKCDLPHARATHGKWIETCTAHKRCYHDGDRENKDPANIYLAPCLKYPPPGGLVCSHHGGNAPHVKEFAERRMMAAELSERIRLESLHVEPRFMEQHPIEGILLEVGRSAQIVEFLAAQTAKLELIDPADHSDTAYLSGMGPDGQEVNVPVRGMLIGPDHQGDLKRHPLWVALDAERERHARLCKVALDAGVNERLVNIAQGQATRMVAIILKVLDAVGLTEDQKIEARKTVAQELRAAGPTGMSAIEASNRTISGG